MQPIITLTLPLEEARELYRALVTRYFVEDTLRREQGLESISLPLLAERLEKTLNFSNERAASELKQVEDELWQHAWLSFTDEWAWHRAKQDILKELGTKQAKRFNADELDALTEKRYEAHLDRYMKEVQLPGHEDGHSCAWPQEQSAATPALKSTKKPSRKA